MKTTMKQVIKKAGGNKAFSEQFNVPIRTVEGWNAGRGCPQYTVDAFAELVKSNDSNQFEPKQERTTT